MEITAVQSTLSQVYTKQKAKEQTTATSSSSIGEAAVLDLSSAQTSQTSGVSASGGAGGGGGASGSSACPRGNKQCVGCGQCGKTQGAAGQQAGGASSFFSTTGTSTDYLTTQAINAYENA